MARTTVGLLAWTACIVAMVVARGQLAPFWPWLLKNLALAWIPLGLGAFASGSRAKLWVAGPLWLAFLPNAPYLLTDLVHLEPRRDVPLWLDIALLGGAGALGLTLGAASVDQVAGAIRREAGPWAARVAIVVATLASGWAMWIGRELRFNSWDVLARPGRLAAEVGPVLLAPADHPQAWGYAATFGTLFLAAALGWRRE